MIDPIRWDAVCARKTGAEPSRTEVAPTLLIELLEAFSDPGRPLIGVGAGRSELVDRLLERGWVDVTAIDLSVAALGIVAGRLGARDDLRARPALRHVARPRRPALPRACGRSGRVCRGRRPIAGGWGNRRDRLLRS